jgi:hypothetical protein
MEHDEELKEDEMERLEETQRKKGLSSMFEELNN